MQVITLPSCFTFSIVVKTNMYFTALLMPLGFFSLQAVNIGLSVGDIGVVSILVTAFSLAFNPLIGTMHIVLVQLLAIVE